MNSAKDKHRALTHHAVREETIAITVIDFIISHADCCILLVLPQESPDDYSANTTLVFCVRNFIFPQSKYISQLLTKSHGSPVSIAQHCQK